MPVSDKYTCSCGKPCGTWPAWQSHMATAHGILVKKGDSPQTVKATTSTVTPVSKPVVTDQPVAIEQSVVTTPTETVITVTPTVQIADPFLSNRVVPPHIGTGVGESSVKPSVTSEKPSLTPEEPSVTPEQPAVEPQKKTATATASKPIVQPIHIHIPKEALPSAEGHRDQPQLEAKPSMMMPLGSITREIEVTTKGMEIQVGSTLLMYYDWLRSKGYERSLSEFINQTVEAYFTEKGLMLGITFKRD